MKLAFIGGGMMGEAIMAGVINQSLAAPSDISVCEIVALAARVPVKRLQSPRHR